MKFALSQRHRNGFSLLLVTFLLGVGFLLMTGALRWSGASTNLAGRYNDYYTSLAAAEAATEKAVGHISHYFQNFGVAGVDSQLANIGGSYPTTVELLEWGNYEFRNPEGGANSTYVVKLSDEQYTTGLNWKYPGFGGYAASYRVVSNARRLASPDNVVGVRQDVQVASLPLFGFAIFYAMDMELHPFTSDFTVNGRVHCNGNIYCEPHSPRAVTFQDHVTAAGKIVHDNHPNDPTSPRVFGGVNYLGERDTGVNALNLPIGTNNTPQILYSIIEMPPTGESPTSLMGQQRYYNKADLIILVSDTNTVAKSGLYNGFATTIPWANMTNFVKTTPTFYDKRESKTIRATEINIGQMIAQYGYLTSILGRAPQTIYVADTRSGGSDKAAVRLINGATLPTNGLTVATLNPLYVQGHYNAYSGHLGTTNTSQTKPASLVADAITILSVDWKDNEANLDLDDDKRNANHTTVNAAVIAGIVQSGNGAYSGGIENALRLLEDWYSASKILTFNGSIVALYDSQNANSPWGGNDVYHPPIRKYSFDANFKDPLKLPPGTPRLRTLIRSEWTAARANSTL